MSEAKEVNRIWEQQLQEKPKHYEWFVAYLQLGPKRNVTQAYNNWRIRERPDLRPKSAASATWHEASHTYNWRERAEAYDRYILEDSVNQIEDQHKAIRVKQMELAHKMVNKASQMLDFPLASTTTKDGKTTVEPTEWGMRDAAALGESATRLSNFAAGVKGGEVVINNTNQNTTEVPASQADMHWLKEFAKEQGNAQTTNPSGPVRSDAGTSSTPPANRPIPAPTVPPTKGSSSPSGEKLV